MVNNVDQKNLDGRKDIEVEIKILYYITPSKISCVFPVSLHGKKAFKRDLGISKSIINGIV